MVNPYKTPKGFKLVGYLCFNDNWNLAPSRQDKPLDPVKDAEFHLAADLEPDNSYTRITALYALESPLQALLDTVPKRDA